MRFYYYYVRNKIALTLFPEVQSGHTLKESPFSHYSTNSKLSKIYVITQDHSLFCDHLFRSVAGSGS